MTLARGGLILLTMGVLAALDFVGAILAKDYAERHRPVTLLAGAAIFLVLFVVYARALEYAELSIVTMGWVVLLQVGLFVFDWRRNGVALDARQIVVVIVIIALQCYLIASTEPSSAAPAAAQSELATAL